MSKGRLQIRLKDGFTIVVTDIDRIGAAAVMVDWSGVAQAPMLLEREEVLFCIDRQDIAAMYWEAPEKVLRETPTEPKPPRR